MNSRKTLLTAAALAALVPLLSHASPERASAKACASAFAASLGNRASPPAFKLDYRIGGSAATADFFPTDYDFMLEARSKTGAAIARAKCSTNSRGAVTAISALPLDARSPALSAQY